MRLKIGLIGGAFCLFSCGGSSTSAPLLSSVTPDQGAELTPVDIEIQGRRFLPRVITNLNSGVSRAEDDFEAILLDGTTRISLEEVTRVDAKALTARIPASLTAGIYALEVTGPYGTSNRLEAAFEVCTPGDDDCSAVGPCVDSDDDGVCDSDDTCWSVANPGDTDSDADCPAAPYGVDPACGDACDTCTDADGDDWGRLGFDQSGCVQLGDDCDDTNATDSDGDNLCDGEDTCWSVANPDDNDTDADCPTGPFASDPACGDACDTCTDADGDGWGLAGTDQSGCVQSGNDCADDPGGCGFDCNPGAIEGPSDPDSCTDGLDNDCNGPIDAGDPGCDGNEVNLVAASEGATLESCTSQWCPGEPNCDASNEYWTCSNIHDGEYAYGSNPTASRAAWVSERDVVSPQKFEFTFDSGTTAWLSRVVIQNYGEEELYPPWPYYSTHFELWGQGPGGGAWFLILDEDLNENETPQTFDVVALYGSTPLLERLRLSITDGTQPDVWELGEFEAWGILN